MPHIKTHQGFPDSSVGKESACNAGGPSLTLGLGRSIGEGIGFPLQYSWWFSWLRICLQYGRLGFKPWVGKIPWRRERLSTPVFQPGEFHGLYSPWDAKEWDTIECLSLSVGNSVLSVQQWWHKGQTCISATGSRLQTLNSYHQNSNSCRLQVSDYS